MGKEGEMVCFGVLLMVCLLLGGVEKGEAYKNYTVGDSLGWFDNLVKPDVDYDTWSSGKTFSLGDFLLFNTDSNHSVIQTHNFTTYTSCDSQGDDTIEWSNINPNSTEVLPITVAVPLLKEGSTYFFSGDYDGEQCMHGQKFEIKVVHGQGLPPSLLRDNPDLASAAGPTAAAANAAPGPANADAGGDDSSTPDIISSNYDFSHPKKVPPSEDGSSSENDQEDGAKTKSNEATNFGPSRGVFLMITFISGLLGLLI